MRTIPTGVTIPCTTCTLDVGVAWVCLPYYSIWYKKLAVDFCWVHSQFLGSDRVLTLHSNSSKYGAYWSDHPLNLLYN